MSNKITEKYFDKFDFPEREKQVLLEIEKKTDFISEKEIFRGEVYDKDKVGSLIYKGKWQDKPAVLKIQLIRPDIEEVDIINFFNKQNKSKKIRLPRLFKSSKWNKKGGYGYLIMEFIGAPLIYSSSFAAPEQIKNFCDFYQEYKTKAINKPFFEKSADELSSLVFTVHRVSHWIKIAQAKNTLIKSDMENIEKFISLAGKHLPGIKMEFMHGHLTYSDIYKISEDEYMLMSNLFWSYRPEYYDATFHLWAGIKNIRDMKVDFGQVVKYVQKWIDEYKKIPFVKKDGDFERKFNIMMAERCIGALLVDLQNQEYEKDKKEHIKHLTMIFRNLFEYFAGKL